ncbi:class I SAM-dependent methyltransferase [Roseiconus nitratireducens]|uniref:class I SAM-dependent methyltransferase n=1 Tax=Roseiconus nitratireducens TaxID=2605748 RepID=UPI001F3AB0B8|nr:class I SAM-dependent methyltransferase [Roseiconus nitratireducens]
MSENRYQLIDFGDGRKLESFDGRLIDRPSPAADGIVKARPSLWRRAESVFDAPTKRWHHRTRWADDSRINCGGFWMPVAATPFGHVGVFPEQAPNWDWLRDTSLAGTSPTRGEPAWGLNLFGYTGASTMAMAISGLAVSHVDAAKPNVTATRLAATINRLQNHPIRYLVDDAAKFAAREVRRGRRYDTIVLDPPAYGHSPKGKAWRLQRDLWPLLDDCVSLLSPDRYRLLVTGHSAEIGPDDVLNYLLARLPGAAGRNVRSSDFHLESGRLVLTDLNERHLDAGFYVRCRRTADND